LVIGDEILSGRTRDTNTQYLATKLAEMGIDLLEVRVVPDDQLRISEAAVHLSETFDHVFTSGGIGPTHDDITADSIALAFGKSISVRDDALEILKHHCARMGVELNDSRLRMARIPEGASLIENSVSAAPGFSIGNVHVMAGVPKIFEDMAVRVLSGLTGGRPLRSRSVEIFRPEGEIARKLGEIVQAFPDLSIGSYPRRIDGRFAVNVVFRGKDRFTVDSAAKAFLAAFPDAADSD
ncbi:MAG: molybdopterin-binding protein, partial [Albidovulum sp.]|nr:molybdopterin-binding protein [Albidovulum sp.]